MESRFNSSSRRTTFYFIFSLTLGLSLSILTTGCGSSSSTTEIGLALGNHSPEIVTENIKGENISLSGHKGSYVLIEFWDSQNSEARKNHYEMQRCYEKYKNAQFDNGEKFCIYSVSLDTDKEKWKAAVAQDNMQWPCNTIDERAWNSPAVLAYNISYLPKYFLIDGDGELVSRNIMIKDLDHILAQNLDGKTSNR